MANIGVTRKTRGSFQDLLFQNSMPGTVRFNAEVRSHGSGTQSPVDIPLNGQDTELDVPDHLYLPPGSGIVGYMYASAYNLTDDVAGHALIVKFAATHTTAGTIAFVPTNLTGSDGNPITEAAGSAGPTIAVAVNNTADTKYVCCRFTPAEEKRYTVAGLFVYAFTGRYMNYSNHLVLTNTTT